MTSKRHSREFWEAAVREVRSGQSVAVVAKRRGVRSGTLSWWLWHLRKGRPKAAKPRRPEPKAAFLPVVVAKPVSTQRLLEIEIAGARIRVESGTDIGYVAALVGALRAC